MEESDHYKGREHSGVKHYLLESYLEKLFMIIGQHERRICYIDCFSGPWKEADKNLSVIRAPSQAPILAPFTADTGHCAGANPRYSHRDIA